MLMEQTIERLRSMRLGAMADRLQEWSAQANRSETTPDDLVGLMADVEWASRENKRLDRRLKNARLRQNACVEDLRYGGERALTKAAIKALSGSRWVMNFENVIVTGATGVGKSYVACAIGNQACRDGHTVTYRRSRRLFDELAMARGDGSHAKQLQKIARANVLIIDDFGTESLDARERGDLLEIVEDRYGRGSTVITSQRDPKDWHGVIGDETIGDAVCDRLVHNAHRIKLAGPSQRKPKDLTDAATTAKGK
jgi:DNA replication protein DnaC